MMPFNMISPLLGAQASQPLVTQSQGLGGPALGALGTMGGALLGKSSEKFKKDIHLLDVREPHELEISKLEDAKLIPLGQLAARLSELDSAYEMVVFCKAGTRSTRALELLTSAGFRKVKNLKGGINAWARDVDPSQPIY